MNESNIALAKGLVHAGYIQQGAQGLAARQKLVTSLLSERRLPAHGWDEAGVVNEHGRAAHALAFLGDASA